jgi:transposase
VDTRADVHVAAVVDRVGHVLGTQAFPAAGAGYAGTLAWMGSHGELARAGVEGTGSNGSGLARHLAACGIEVVEVMRPNRQAGRPERRGVRGAKEPRRAAESIRALRVARAARSRPAPRPATSCAT